MSNKEKGYSIYDTSSLFQLLARMTFLQTWNLLQYVEGY